MATYKVPFNFNKIPLCGSDADGTIKINDVEYEPGSGPWECEMEDDSTVYTLMVEGITGTIPSIVYHINIYKNNDTNALYWMTIQAKSDSKFGAIAINRYPTTSGVDTQTWTLRIGDTIDMKELTGNNKYGEYTFMFDVSFIKNRELTPTTYPVVFYDGVGENPVFIATFENEPLMDWKKTYDGGFRPADSVWFNYQSSYYIDQDMDSVELNDMSNIFYKKITPEENGDNMRVLISAPKLKTLDFGEIQTITDNYNSVITTTPILPYGYSNAFCMDTGVKRQITVKYKRTMGPGHCDDSSSDSRDWTNAEWLKQFKKYTNRWQMRTNGVHLYILMPGNNSRTKNMDECYPPINPNPKETKTESLKENSRWVNAYITNAPISYTTTSNNMIESTITFQIGTIYPASVAPKKTKVTLVLTDDNGAQIYSETKYVVRNSENKYPPIPSTFYNYRPNVLFRTWYDSNDPEPISPAERTQHYIGSSMSVGDVEDYGTLTAVIYTSEIRCFYVQQNGSEKIYEYELPDIFIPGNYYEIHMIGGGGGGGGWTGDRSVPTEASGGGGGGGAGFVKVNGIYYVDGQKFTVHIGAGGAGKNADNYGENGGTTYVTLADGTHVGDDAKGGFGGSPAGKHDDHGAIWNGGYGGKGGSGVGTNGNGGNGGDGKPNPIFGPDPKDGDSASGSSERIERTTGKTFIAGRGGTHESLSNAAGGGGGGGMPDSTFFEKVGDTVYTSYGGQGRWSMSKSTTDMVFVNGFLGGGGGGGHFVLDTKPPGGNGGDGMIYIVGEFK